jgi:hypothetical protein
MIRYLLQSDSKGLDIEYNICEDILKRNKYVFECESCGLKSLTCKHNVFKYVGCNNILRFQCLETKAK